MHILNKKFEKVYCINLISRPDRRIKMERRFKELGIEAEFFTTVEYGFNKIIQPLLKQAGYDWAFPNEVGCSVSHYSIIKLAKEQKLKNVFIFEDDTVFHKSLYNDTRISSYNGKEFDATNMDLKRRLDLLPEDWDLFYLYLLMYQQPTTQLQLDNSIYHDSWQHLNSLSLYRPREAHCASAYAVNSKFYDTIINSMDNNFEIVDATYRHFQDNPDYKIYATYPNMCSQEMGYSDLRNGICDYFKGWSFGKRTIQDYY